MDSRELITSESAATMAAAKAINDVLAIPVPREPSHWTLIVCAGPLRRTIRMRDANRPRVFRSADAVVTFASKLGIKHVSFELANWRDDARRNF